MTKAGKAAKTAINRRGVSRTPENKPATKKLTVNPTKEGQGNRTEKRTNQRMVELGSSVYLDSLEATEPEQNNYGHPLEVGKVLTGKGIRKIKYIQQIGHLRNSKRSHPCGTHQPNLVDVGLKIYVPHIEKGIIELAVVVPPRYSKAKIFENLQVAEEVICVERMKRKKNKET